MRERCRPSGEELARPSEEKLARPSGEELARPSGEELARLWLLGLVGALMEVILKLIENSK